MSVCLCGCVSVNQCFSFSVFQCVCVPKKALEICITINKNILLVWKSKVLKKKKTLFDSNFVLAMVVSLNVLER